jgi:TPP-dependent trihydroxycyclohexane-1,2-dione (THcHDO) dehydratase
LPAWVQEPEHEGFTNFKQGSFYGKFIVKIVGEGAFGAGSKSQFKNSGVRIVTINNNRYHASKMDAVKAVGDAKATLVALSVLLREKGYKSAWQNEIRDTKAAWDAEMKRLGSYIRG